MSKQKTTKQMPLITGWLKKENLLEVNDKSGKTDSKGQIKKSIRICLEELDKNTIEQAKILDQQKLNQEKNIDVVDQSKNLRRSSRNLQCQKKQLQENPILKESNIEDLSPITFKGCINYISDFYECANICDILLIEIDSNKDAIIPVGFDLEWPFSFQTGSGKTALAQICLNEKTCYLLHLYNINKLPASFTALLSHPKVKLVGVNVKNDVWKLTRDFKGFPGQKVVTNNCLDCGVYANRILNQSGRWSLERLTAYVLKRKIIKDPSVRRSKWHIQPLNDAQKLYAATDAYVSLLIHLEIAQYENILTQADKGSAVLKIA